MLAGIYIININNIFKIKKNYNISLEGNQYIHFIQHFKHLRGTIILFFHYAY